MMIMNEEQMATTMNVLIEMIYPEYLSGNLNSDIDLSDLSLKKCLALLKKRQTELKNVHEELYEESKNTVQFLMSCDEKMYQELKDNILFSVSNFAQLM